MKFDLLLFDLDGTLIDSQHDVGRALNRVLADFEIAPLDAQTIRTHVGYGIKPLLEQKLREKGITETESAFATFTDYYLENCARETKLYLDVADGLARLSAYRKMILTNKSVRFISKILEGLHVDQYFVQSYGRESFAKTKPDPLPILSILEEDGIARERALMIGDTETDILAGERAGVQTCLVTYGYGNLEVQKTLKPTFTISCFADLLPILEGAKDRS